jgi:hypothetical protein
MASNAAWLRMTPSWVSPAMMMALPFLCRPATAG